MSSTVSTEPHSAHSSRPRRDRSHYHKVTPEISSSSAADNSSDALNAVSMAAAKTGHVYEVPSVTHQSALAGAPAHADCIPSERPVTSPMVGTFSYRFTVDSNTEWRAFTGTVRQDGTIDSNASKWDGKQWAATTLPPPQVSELRQIAREDVATKRDKNPGVPAEVVADLTPHQILRVSNAHGKWLDLMEQAAEGNAPAARAREMLENYSVQALDTLLHAPRRVDELLSKPENRRGAEQYRALHPDTELSVELGKRGVALDPQNGAAAGQTQSAACVVSPPPAAKSVRPRI